MNPGAVETRDRSAKDRAGTLDAVAGHARSTARFFGPVFVLFGIRIRGIPVRSDPDELMELTPSAHFAGSAIAKSMTRAGAAAPSKRPTRGSGRQIN